MPLMIVQKVGKLGILKGMPDLSRVTFKEILGTIPSSRAS